MPAPRTEAPPLPLGAAPLVTIVEAARRTGVDPTTLRAWERRYGVPRPARTPSGYRLYNARDLRDIAALVSYRASGIAIRQAAFLVARQRTLAADGASASRVASWRRRLERACLRFDDAAATALFAEAGAVTTRSELLEKVVFPVVATIGQGRDSGVISISQEHFASELARRLVSGQEVAPGARSASGLILTGCAPGELHELGLLSVVWQLRAAGHRVVHLGANVPVAAFLSALERLRPRSAIVAVTMGSHLNAWQARRAAVEAWSRRGVRFVWAGPGAMAVRDKLPGVASDAIADVVAAAGAAGDEERRPPGRTRTRVPRAAPARAAARRPR